jgi:tRNA (adenine22-N1)-methyltransferase
MTKAIDLEARLFMIAQMIPVCEVLCDIGTDHAYIPLYAAQMDLCKKIIATDIREGPLRIAKNNIEEHGLSHMIELRLGDGLDCIQDHEADTVLICGMGGLTITEMLEKNKRKVDICNRLIIQCMYADEMVREYCYKNGLDISEERICCDRNKLYTAMSIIPGGLPKKVHPAFYHASPSLLEQKTDLVLKYLDRRIGLLTRIRSGMKRAKDPDSEKTDELKEIINKLKDIKNERKDGKEDYGPLR